MIEPLPGELPEIDEIEAMIRQDMGQQTDEEHNFERASRWIATLPFFGVLFITIMIMS